MLGFSYYAGMNVYLFINIIKRHMYMSYPEGLWPEWISCHTPSKLIFKELALLDMFSINSLELKT